jgi:hypothetical protein
MGGAYARIKAASRMITATAVDRHVEQLFDVLARLHSALTEAKIDYGDFSPD